MKHFDPIKQLKNYTLLYVEDNIEISEEVVFFLQTQVKELILAYNGEEGIEAYQKHKPDIIITDVQMPSMNGIEMIGKIRNENSDVPIVITTAFNESDYLLKAINLHVDAYVMKPLNLKKLMDKIYKIIEPIELKRQLVLKNSELEHINANLDAIAKEKTKELEYFYNHDPLTGLSNFLQLGKEIQERAYKSLILLDISNFSIINKQYGKAFADEILKLAAKNLELHLRDNMRLFKTNSDTFVILTKESEEHTIECFCKQIISFFDTTTIHYDDVELKINFSMGIAPIVDDFYPMVNAEYALEIGKKIGSRYYYFYDDTQENLQRAREAIMWINVTKKLIEEDKIEPYFQPLQDFQTGKIVKYEVLARGDYDGEILSPYRFIEPAEKLGLISSITRMMVNKSFQFFSKTSYSFSINMTQRDLLDEYLISFLEQKLASCDIDAKNVTFEVLETVSIGDHHEVVMNQLRRLKDMGFKIAIDDFGIQNSNFARLLEIDFDYLKLDGVFIRNLIESKKDRSILSAIITLAKSIGAKTVAEYVSNEMLYNLLKERGIDLAQGYYIQRPMSPQEMTNYLEEQKKQSAL